MKLMAIDRNRKRKRTLVSDLVKEQKGQLLIEVLVAVAILGVVTVAFLSALVTSYGAVALADRKATAESLTRTEFERVKGATYPITNYTVSSTPAGYVVSVQAAYIDPTTYAVTTTPEGMQMITVTVNYNGKVVSTTRANKVNR